MELNQSNRVVLAFGSNLGDKEQNIRRAIDLIALNCGRVVQVSSFYQNEAVGFESSHSFVNGCLLLLTNLTPKQLLLNLKEIEAQLGRVKVKIDQYEDRSIDLDIILYENLCIHTPELQIPHPRFQERSFVLEPMRELSLDFFPF